MRRILNLERFNPHDNIPTIQFDDLTPEFLSRVKSIKRTTLPLGFRVFVLIDPKNETKAEPFFQIGKTKPHVPDLTHGMAFSFDPTRANFSTIRDIVSTRSAQLASFILQPESGKSFGDLWHSIKSYRKDPIPYEIWLEDPVMDWNLNRPIHVELKTKVAMPENSTMSFVDIPGFIERFKDLDYNHYLKIVFSDNTVEDRYLVADLKGRSDYQNFIGKFDNFLNTKIPQYRK